MIIERAGLLEELDDARPITLVSAPAGYGKTTLVASWVGARHLGQRAAWMMVPDEIRAGDSRDLWQDVLDAVIAWAPSDTGSGLRAESSEVIDATLNRAQEMTEPAWLIFDDVHELAREARGYLERLISCAPPQLRFILITRHDLRLGLHRVRLEEALTEIRSTDLRFNLAETKALFDAAEVAITELSARRLLERTEGWAAGLRLAALSMGRAKDPDRLADRFSGTDRGVAEYLLAEVLDRQPDEVTRLLLRTSILDEVSGPLADYLTGFSGSRRILVELEEAGAFVVAVDRERRWFRYHPLFRELLDLELHRTTPEVCSALRAAAAEWYETHGRPVDAIRQAQAAEDWPRAARILVDRWHDLFLGDEWRAAYELLASFPANRSRRHPELTVVAAAEASDRGAFAEAERLLASATQRLSDAPGEHRPQLQLAIASETLRLARNQGDLDAALTQVEVLRDVGNRLPFGEPRLHRTLHAVAVCNLGITETWARHASAEAHLHDAIDAANSVNRPVLVVTALTHLAVLQSRRALESGEATAQRALEIAGEHGWLQAPFCAIAYALLAAVSLAHADLPAAADWLERGERCFRLSSRPTEALRLSLTRGIFELSRGRPTAALELFEGVLATDHAAGGSTLTVADVEANRCRSLIALGRIENARQILDELAPHEQVALHAVEGMCRLAEGDPLGALAATEHLEGEGFARAWAIDGLLVRARAAAALGDPAEVAASLERALDLAEPAGLILPFLLAHVGDLLMQHGRRGTSHPALAGEISDALDGTGPTAARGHESVDLTESELRVLRYLPTNMSTPEIASTLFVSANTVRTHVSHIYAKLGSHSRGEAVEEARRQGLVSPGVRTRTAVQSSRNR